MRQVRQSGVTETTGTEKRHRWILSLAAILSLLAFSVVPATPVPRGPLSSSAAVAATDIAAAPAQQPVRYTRNARIEQVDDHYVAHIYQGPIAYKDSAGAWRPIDNTLVPSSDGSHFANKANGYTVSFPVSLATGSIHIQTTSGSIDLTPKGTTGPGTVSGSTITYPFTGGTLAYTASNAEVKESITLLSPAAPSSFTTDVQVSSGLSPQSDSAGAIQFKTAAGDGSLSLAAPSVADKAGATSSDAVSMSMAPNGDGDTVTISLSSSWLSDPARAWPVVIDPTTVINGATQDCTLDSTNPNTSECSSTSLSVGGASLQGSPFYNALLQFSLAGAVPSGALNISATLQLYHTQAETQRLTEGQVTRAWTNSATWNTYDGTNSWTTPGGDYACNPSCGGAGTGNTTGWWSIPVNDAWVQGGTNFGLLLKWSFGLAREPAPDTFYSSDYSDPTYWPELVVNYWLPQTGHRPFYTEASSALSDSIALAANVESGNVTVDQSDVSMPGIGLPLEIGRTYNSWNATSGEIGAFGLGWSMDTGQDVYLTPQSDQSVNYTAPTGFTVNYQHNADGSYTTPAGMDNTLVKNGDGTYILTDHASQEALHFNSSGLLTSDVDRVGNTIS